MPTPASPAASAPFDSIVASGATIVVDDVADADGVTDVHGCFSSPYPASTPRWISGAGIIGCIALGFSLPVPTLLTGAALFAIGLAYLLLRRATGSESSA